VTLEGWTLDNRVQHLAIRLARRAAGRRAVQTDLRTRPATAGSGANAVLT
jgi:hypothetical protein